MYICSGAEYDGELGGVGRLGDTAQMASMKPLNSCLRLVKNWFMGSIQASLAPNVVWFARPCKVFAMRVKLRCARGFRVSGVRQYNTSGW